MRNTQESGQILRSKKRPRRTLRSGRGSRTNSNTSRQIPARVIDAFVHGLISDTILFSLRAELRDGIATPSPSDVPIWTAAIDESLARHQMQEHTSLICARRL